jgi:hypothetical protein
MYGSAPYPGAYPYYPPPPPPPKAAAGSGFPPWVWVALGVALAGLGGKLLEGAKSKQQDIQQAMMQQMLKSMMGGAAPPGGMPFPGGAAGFPRPPTPPPSAAGKGATVDTTATAVKEAPKVRRRCGREAFVGQFPEPELTNAFLSALPAGIAAAAAAGHAVHAPRR